MSRPLRIETSTLARHLHELGWRDLLLPDGLAPVARAGGRVAEAGGPRSDTGKAPSAPGSGAAFEIPADLAGDRRLALLDEVRAHAEGCTACPLAEQRRSVVFGTGDGDASLMLVGEGPGAQEDRQGLPFVGPAGELLTRMLAAIDLPREQVYIANVVKCRPPGNRDPRPEEVSACSGYLKAQIELVRPRLVLALGRVAAQSLLVTGEPLGRLRGRWHEVHGVPLRVTYHPAALLRNASYKRPAWEDLQLIRDRLGELEGGG